MTEIEQIDSFLSGSSFAVVGASANRSKYGNKVLRNYMQRNMQVYPVNPHAKTIEGLHAYPALDALPQRVHGISIITPPLITESVVEQALKLGIHHLWLQPGAESPRAVAKAVEAGANIIHSGACLLVVLRFTER